MKKVWIAGDRRRNLGVALGVVALAATVFAEGGALPVQEDARQEVGERRSEGKGEDTTLDRYKNEARTEEGQIVFPEQELINNWKEDCKEWVNTDTRRVMIHTAFEPDIIFVEVKGTDPMRTWTTDKVYPIEPQDFHVWGDWRKAARAKMDVGVYKTNYRTEKLISHEKECISKLVGLPALVLVGEVSGADPMRYSMVVEEAHVKYLETVTHRANTAVYGSKYVGTVEMSETFWSAARRKWDSWLG